MDFMRTLLAYMAATFLVAVESTSTPGPTPEPTPVPPNAIVEMATATPTPSPTPTVSVTPVPVPTITANTAAYHNLAQGDKGADVKKLQEKLIELGYLPEGSADGAYGGQTRNAVRRFQYYNGLSVDGVAGRATQTNLFENPDAAPAPTETPTPSPTPTAEPTEVPTEAPTEEVTAAPTEAPTEEMTAAPTEEATAAPTEEVTEAPTEAPTEEMTEVPTEEVTEAPTEAPTEERTEAPTEEVTAAPTEEVTEEPTQAPEETPEVIVENVDLDESWQEINARIVLNDSGAPMSWLALVDGVNVEKKPRIQEREGLFRISLADVVNCAEGWELTDDGDTVVLQAAGYTLGLYNETAGKAATVDGIEMEMEGYEYDFVTPGNYIAVDFLCRAMNGEWEWDGEEFTLMLRIPDKNVSKATD